MFRLPPLLLLSLWSGLLLAQAAPPPSVVVDAVRAGNTEASSRALSGHVYTRQTLTVMASQAGRLLWIREAGEVAKAGEPLAKLDTQPLELAREEQLARLRRSGVELKHMDKRLSRAQQLDAQAFVSRTELDDLRERRELALADIAIARAQVSQLDDRIARATVLAPFDGVVTEQLRHAGEEVGAGAVLGAFLGTGALEVRAQVPLRWLKLLQPGSQIPVLATAQQGWAVVRSSIPAADTTSQTFELRADIPSPSAWAIGQLVELQLPELQAQSSLLVPRDAVVLRREGARVVRIDSTETAHWVRVELGRGQGEWIAVRGPLQVGDRVAVRGAERLGDQQSVQVLRDLAAEPSAAPVKAG